MKAKDKRKKLADTWIGSGMTARMCALTRKRLKRRGTKKHRVILRKDTDDGVHGR